MEDHVSRSGFLTWGIHLVAAVKSNLSCKNGVD